MSRKPNDAHDLPLSRSSIAQPTSDGHFSHVQPRVPELKKKLASDAGSLDATEGNKIASWRQPHIWNTQDLGLRVGGDVMAASAAGAMVAPLITIIDRAIIENASNRSDLLTSVKTSFFRLLTTPHRFLSSRPFLLVSMLYGTTYFAANSIDTISSTISSPHSQPPRKGRPDPRSPEATTAGTPKFLATSTANLSLCIYKDSQFAKLFGPRSSLPVRPVAFPSLALFAVRDALTIFASFNAPSLIAPNLYRLGFKPAWEQHVSRASAAQFMAPAAVQLLSTPLHLWGLDLYNRPNNISLKGRVAKVTRDYAGSCAARMCRIIPAFGFGGVVNTSIRKGWMIRLPSSS